MLQRLTLLFYLILLMSLLSCQSEKDKLKSDVESLLSEQRGTFAVAFKNLASNKTLLINEHESFHAASTMKTPVMIEVFSQAKAGKFQLTDSMLIKNEFKSIVDNSTFSLDSADDSERGLYNQIGKKRSIYDLMYDMIIVSSNLATNLIIELVDGKNVTATMRTVGAEKIQVLRGVEDGKAFEQGLNNTTTAYDLMLIFEKIAKEEMVSTEASQAMIKILLDQKFNEIIPARLPEGVKVAHKTGSINGVQHDSGIVVLPDGRKYVLVILSKGLADPDKAVDMMARISERIYKSIEQ
jgi:beta-lactamase class A